MYCGAMQDCTCSSWGECSCRSRYRSKWPCISRCSAVSALLSSCHSAASPRCLHRLWSAITDEPTFRPISSHTCLQVRDVLITITKTKTKSSPKAKMNQVLDHSPMSLLRFSLLSKSSAYVQPTDPLAIPSSSNDSVQSKLSKYAAELEEQSHRPGPGQKPLSIWLSFRSWHRSQMWQQSQANVERIFSVCGLLSHGNRNRMSKSLEMSVLETKPICTASAWF